MYFNPTRQNVLKEFPELGNPNYVDPPCVPEHERMTGEQRIQDWLNYWNSMATILDKAKQIACK